MQPWRYVKLANFLHCDGAKSDCAYITIIFSDDQYYLVRIRCIAFM